MKYVKKSAIVDVEFAQENGLANTWSGDLPYFQGDAITTNEYGEVNVWSRQVFEDNFTPLQKVEAEHEFTYDDLESGYAQDWVGDEDENYIKSMQEMAEGK